jgi:hypothetical protein
MAANGEGRHDNAAYGQQRESTACQRDDAGPKATRNAPRLVRLVEHKVEMHPSKASKFAGLRKNADQQPKGSTG